VVEIGGIGPSPFCAMMLSDMGADVLRIDRAAEAVELEEYVWPPDYLLNRGRQSVGIDLKHPEGVEAVLRLIDQADAVIEGFRPGVAERLGFGPEVCRRRNPQLVYGRMTGWGQTGTLARTPGHDLNYIATTGVLDAIGTTDGGPAPPLNLVGDFGGGGMLLTVGVLAAIIEARNSGKGQTVDAAMVDGAALLATMFYGMRDMGQWAGGRGGNLLDGGAHFYSTYETADGARVSIAAMEPRFYVNLLGQLDLDPVQLPPQYDTASWPEMKRRFADIFRTKTREQWTAQLQDAEVCFAPVLDLDEARGSEHNRERGVFVEYAGVVQPAPAPRFQRTPGEIAGPPPAPGEHTRQGLTRWGFLASEIDHLEQVGAINVDGSGVRGVSSVTTSPATGAA
jgi:alpha-methylacyl-CoA racemase